MSKVIIGTELKLNVNIAPIGDLTMEDYNFEIKLICGSLKKTSKTFKKSELIKQNSSNYLVAFNTSDLGVGKVTCAVIAYLPDSDFEGNERTEIVEIDTGIEIVKGVG